MISLGAIKLGLAINTKLDESMGSYRRKEKDAIMKAFLESVEGKGQFTVVDWSVLGKQLEVFGGNGKE